MIRRLRDLFRPAGKPADSPPDAIVVGLGNPGSKYANTRHNIGFRVIECLAARHGGAWHEDRSTESMLARVEISGRSVALMAPQTFMNRSGESLEGALRRWPDVDPTRDLLVIYDDLDLPTGRIRLRPSGGAGGHNGIGDILERLGTREVARLRFGIGHPGPGGAVIDWVLSDFSDDEAQRLAPAVDWAADAVEAALAEGVSRAMGRFNAERPAER